MKYDTVLFDLDGTLTDSAPGILNSIRHALVKMAHPVPDDAILTKFVGPPLLDSFQRYCGMTPEASAEALRLYREYFTTKGLYENSVYPGVVEMLETLRGRGEDAASTGERGTKIVLATSKPEPFARKILDHFGLTKHFDAIHGATLDETRCRKADVIAWALAHSGLPDGCGRSEASVRNRVVMVGDRANDIEGARANGLGSIGVLWGYGDAAELTDAGATVLAATPADVVRCVLP